MKISAQLLAVARRAGGLRPQFVQALHPKQRDFVEDKSPRKAAVCSRRAGKTHGVGALLIDGAEVMPGEKSVYVGLTRSKAREVIWDQCLNAVNDQYHLGLALKYQDGQLAIHHPNGHRIWLLGVDKKSEVRKLRGERLFRAVIDEAQAYGAYLRELVEEATEWALMDLQGQMILTGTPNPACAGYFWGATTGQSSEIAQWSTHHWTVLDNPHIPHAAQWLEELKRRNGWDDTHPTFMREGGGLWVRDTHALIYPFTRERNGWAPQPVDASRPFGLPNAEWRYGLGVDLGFSERSTAFTLVAASRELGRLVVLESYKRSRLDPNELATHIQTIQARVRGLGGILSSIVIDEGALGGGYAKVVRKLGVGNKPAEKTQKRAYQELVGSLIAAGVVQVHYSKCTELTEEASLLQFDPETGKEDERYVNHCCDSFLYIAREMAPSYEPQEVQPQPGTPAAIKAELDAHKRKLIKKAGSPKSRQR